MTIRTVRKISNNLNLNASTADLSTLTVSPWSRRFHGSYFISHGFVNFKWIFSETRMFLRKQTIVAWSSTYKKIYISKFIILIQKLPLRSVLKVTVLGITKNSMEDIH